MLKRTSLAIGSLLAIALSFAGTLFAPVASATSPFASAQWSTSRDLEASGCAITDFTPASPPSNTTLPADGLSHAFNQDDTATVTKSGDATDITQASLSEHSVGRLTSKGADPAAVTMSYAGSAALGRSKAPSACEVSGNAANFLVVDVTLTKPMWVDTRFVQQGRGDAQVEIDANGSGDTYLFLENFDTKNDLSQRSYLPADTYRIFMVAEQDVTNANASMSGSVSMKFTDVGARTAGPSGTATSYVGLGSARDCTHHTLATQVTSTKRRAKTIKKIVFTVNGHKIKTVRSHLRGKTIPLTLSDTKTANVKATVTTATVKKKHHHKKKIHKTRTVTASYLACS